MFLLSRRYPPLINDWEVVLTAQLKHKGSSTGKSQEQFFHKTYCFFNMFTDSYIVFLAKTFFFDL